MHAVVFPVLRTAAAGAVLLSLTGFAGQTGASRFALAQVLEPGGKSLVDVGPDDFVIQESGAEREILDVRVADYPLVIVVDNGAKDDFEMMRASVVRMLDRLGPRPIAIITAGGTPKVAASFENERPEVMERLRALEPTADAASQPLRATAMAGELIKNTGAFFSAVVAITASPIEVTGTEADPLFAPIIDSRAVIHVVTNVNGIGQNVQLLRSIADQTHGDFTPIYSPASYLPAMDRLVARLTTELLIEYIVPVGSKASDVKIGVRIPGARVRGLGVAPR
jgi:hypothetical protein